ncbi:hypothetical protein P9112_001830 [Eukaryota sp. TZLM1-RC]
MCFSPHVLQRLSRSSCSDIGDFLQRSCVTPDRYNVVIQNLQLNNLFKPQKKAATQPTPTHSSDSIRSDISSMLSSLKPSSSSTKAFQLTVHRAFSKHLTTLKTKHTVQLQSLLSQSNSTSSHLSSAMTSSLYNLSEEQDYLAQRIQTYTEQAELPIPYIEEHQEIDSRETFLKESVKTLRLRHETEKYWELVSKKINSIEVNKNSSINSIFKLCKELIVGKIEDLTLELNKEKEILDGNKFFVQNSLRQFREFNSIVAQKDEEIELLVSSTYENLDLFKSLSSEKFSHCLSKLSKLIDFDFKFNSILESVLNFLNNPALLSKDYSNLAIQSRLSNHFYCFPLYLNDLMKKILFKPIILIDFEELERQHECAQSEIPSDSINQIDFELPKSNVTVEELKDLHDEWLNQPGKNVLNDTKLIDGQLVTLRDLENKTR